MGRNRRRGRSGFLVRRFVIKLVQGGHSTRAVPRLVRVCQRYLASSGRYAAASDRYLSHRWRVRGIFRFDSSPPGRGGEEWYANRDEHSRSARDQRFNPSGEKESVQVLESRASARHSLWRHSASRV